MRALVTGAEGFVAANLTARLLREAFVQAAERSEVLAGRVYNIDRGKQMTLRQLVDCVRGIVAAPAEPSRGSYPQHIWDTNV
jgi:nucleoside-diphosphate-sugar epimerase